MCRGLPAVTADEDGCPVCHGSRLLLKEACPLCVDELEDVGLHQQEHLAGKTSSASTACRPALMPKSPLCLVLDIDGTLLAESENVSVETMASLLRPNLDEFLDYAFASFSAVAIWTAGSKEWLDAFLEAADPDGRRQWAFTWSYSRISWVRMEGETPEEPAWQHVKRLSKIWKNKALRAQGFSPRTTLIVDNNPSVCLTNYGNAIYIKTYSDVEDPSVMKWDGEGDGRDDWLLALMEYLKHLHETQVPGETICHIDKRGWYSETKRAAHRQRAHTA